MAGERIDAAVRERPVAGDAAHGHGSRGLTAPLAEAEDRAIREYIRELLGFHVIGLEALEGDPDMGEHGSSDVLAEALGLGAQISSATDSGNGRLLLLSTVVMATLVVCVNRLVWRPLYRLAESRYRLDS